MRINSNIPSLMAQRQLSITTKAIARSLGRLSTGARVSGAFDGDTASLSVINKLEAQRRGYLQANQNINQAQGMLSTAESAMSTQVEILTRMRELTLQASNGTLTSTDRANINLEVSQLFQEFQRITNTTEFNGTKLLDGSLGQKTLQTQANPQNGLDVVRFEIGDLNAANVFLKTVGTGSFSTRVTKVPDAFTISQIVTGDFNGDGKVDTITLNGDQATASVMLGNGDGTFDRKSNFTVGEGFKAAVGDLNGDHIQDLVVLTVDGVINTFTGKGDGTFSAGTTFAGITQVALGDFNSDGNLDIFTGNVDFVNIDVHLGDGHGQFSSAQTTGASASGSVYDFQVVDMNNDGRSDIFVNDGDISTNLAFINNGNGTAVNTWSLGLVMGSSQFGDLNNDGNLDMILDTYIYIGNGQGSFTQGSATIGTSAAVKIGDLNGDGNVDLISTAGRTLYGKGDGTFTFARTVNLGSGVAITDLADLNGDGVLDLVELDTSNVTTSALSSALQTTTTNFSASRIDVSTQAKSQSLLSILDTALNALRSEQNRVGALHERLDLTASNNLLMSDNLSEAKARTQDVDIALETAELVRNQILQQAQVAVMAQANIQLRLALDLLKF